MSDGGGSDRPRDVAHVCEQVLGGRDVKPDSTEPKKRPRRYHLRIIDEPALFEPKPGLPPGGRDECRTGERPCPYVRCEWHLWMVRGDDRAGRRGRGAFGKDSAERKLESMLEPRWLEWPTPVCCGLDIVEATARHRRTDPRYLAPARVIGDAFGRSPASVWLLLARAQQKLRQMQEAQDLQELAAEEPETQTMAEGCRQVPAHKGTL